MIRLATKADTDTIIKLMFECRQESLIKKLRQSGDETARLILDRIFNLNWGFVLLDERENEVIGMLVALKSPNMWDFKVSGLNVFIWFVKPEHRNGTSAGRLFKSYQDAARLMLESGEIDYYLITKRDCGPDLDYARYGYEKQEETWICQKQ